MSQLVYKPFNMMLGMHIRVWGWEYYLSSPKECSRWNRNVPRESLIKEDNSSLIVTFIPIERELPTKKLLPDKAWDLPKTQPLPNDTVSWATGKGRPDPVRKKQPCPQEDFQQEVNCPIILILIFNIIFLVQLILTR